MISKFKRGTNPRSHGHRATHRMSETSVYKLLNTLRQRCDNPNAINFKDYGGRGISYDPRWKKIENFIQDMGLPPSKHHSIDRVDNNGNYYKENCRWATRVEQNRNQRSNRRFDCWGESLLLSEWAEKTGIKRSTLAQRIYVYDWSIDRALSKIK